MAIHLLIRIKHTHSEIDRLIRIIKETCLNKIWKGNITSTKIENIKIELVSRVHYKNYKKKYLIWPHKTRN